MSKQLHSFEGMGLVQRRYSESKLSDTAFATYATTELRRPYSVAHIRQYRQVLKIENNATRSMPLKVYVVIDTQATYGDCVSAVFTKQKDAEDACAGDESLLWIAQEVK